MRARGRMSWMIAVGVVALAGCTSDPSPLEAEQDVHLSVPVHDSDGQQIKGANVVVRKILSANEMSSEELSLRNDLGLGCVGPNIAGPCDGQRASGRTDADGTARLTTKGKHLKDQVSGNVSRVSAAVALPGSDDELSGPLAARRFEARSTTVDVAPIVVWTARPSITVEAGAVRVRWPVPPAELLGDPVRVVFDDDQGGIVAAAAAPASAGEVTLDARLLEEFRGGVSLWASGGDAAARTARLAWKSTGGSVPVSRGRPCQTENDASTTSSPAPDVGCTVTDGRLRRSDVYALASTIDLGAAAPVGLVVARGCAPACTVELSVDGTAWTPVGAPAHDVLRFATYALAAPTEARFVRVTRGSGYGPYEVSVWPDVVPPPTAGLEMVDRDVVRPASSSLWRWVLIGLAGVLIVGCAVVLFRAMEPRWRRWRQG